MKKAVRILLIGLIILVGLVLIVPLLIPLPGLSETIPPIELAYPDSRFIELNGLRIHYQENGSGERVMFLLHGFAASTFSWREVRQPLADMGWRVIAYDRPAFGLTERPLEWEGANPYSAEAQVDLLTAFMDELQIGSAVLVGNSAGGAMAAQFALAHPERVESLVLVDPSIYTSGGFPQWTKPFLRTPQGERLGLLLVRRFLNTGDNFAASAWHDPSRITPQVWEGYSRPLRADHWDEALWAFTVAQGPADLVPRLDEIRLPVLVITGDDDRIVPTEESIRLAGELPNAELVVIPQCGHVSHEECPQAFLEAVQNWLNNAIRED